MCSRLRTWFSPTPTHPLSIPPHNDVFLCTSDESGCEAKSAADLFHPSLTCGITPISSPSGLQPGEQQPPRCPSFQGLSHIPQPLSVENAALTH